MSEGGRAHIFDQFQRRTGAINDSTKPPSLLRRSAEGPCDASVTPRQPQPSVLLLTKKKIKICSAGQSSRPRAIYFVPDTLVRRALEILLLLCNCRLKEASEEGERKARPLAEPQSHGWSSPLPSPSVSAFCSGFPQPLLFMEIYANSRSNIIKKK